MELYQLRGFAAVAEQGHLTRAADALHLSQPALSAQIKALEEELGVALFERRADGMGLTPAGRRLLASAQDVIAAALALRSKARELGGAAQGRVRLGTVADPDFVRLPQVLLGAAQQHPLLEVEVTQQVSGEAFARVRDGRLDASFHFGDLVDPAVEVLALRRFDAVVAAPAGWRARLAGTTFADLASEPWILTPPASTLRVLCDAQFARAGVSPVVRVSADNEDVVRSLVAAGLGLALLRDDVARSLADEGSIAIWDGARLPCELRFVWNRARAGDPALRAVVALVAAAWPEAAARPEAAAPKRKRMR